MCHVSCVACHLSHIPNANSHSHRPSPCLLPQYALQDAAVDLDLYPSTMSSGFCNFWPFWAKITNSEINMLLLLFPEEFFCNWFMWLSTFVYKSNKIFKITMYVKTHFLPLKSLELLNQSWNFVVLWDLETTIYFMTND